MTGGCEKILARGRELHDEGKYLLAQEILNELVQAEPQNQVAKDLLADVFKQLGSHQENPGLRNCYLGPPTNSGREFRKGKQLTQAAPT